MVMSGKMESFILRTKKGPFGIIAGACAMVVFFATVGLIVAYAVTSGIAKQTSDTVSFVQEWWQLLIFIVDIIAALIAVVSLVMYVLKKIYIGKQKQAEEVSYERQA